MEQIWTYVPDGAGDDDEEMTAWTGRIWSDGDQMTRWQFEVLRLAKDLDREPCCQSGRVEAVGLDAKPV